VDEAAGRGDASETPRSRRKLGSLAVLGLVNAVALACFLHPWLARWQREAHLLLLVEVVVLAVGAGPIFLYHYAAKKKGVRRSVEDTAQTIVDFLSGWV
jgi:hypothetical protein